MSTIEKDVERRLHDRNVRYTSGRRSVVRALSDAEGPRSAVELQEDLSGAVPLSSIYRSLAVLEESGIAVPHLGDRQVTRYELAEWLTGHHHHLICVDCGAVEDIILGDGLERQVMALVADVGAAASFKPMGHSLEIEGRCAGCS